MINRYLIKNSPLVSLNNFNRQDKGVFIQQDRDGLSYSDGDVEEQYIYRVISSVGDVSSLSEELRNFERDWASECHLSSKRANVFRALDFSDVHYVLEIGSGCGAITRFLGEQGGQVDAVEGSLRRAEITRLRCRDLDNVHVFHADFNTLKLPESHYDLALLTGVLEYAGKFAKSGKGPVDAAVAMLKRIVTCLSPGGKVIVAIENRIGFKYLAGACEDHFSRPWVGVSNYPDCDDPTYREKQGIETWDKGQWKEMLKRLQGVSSSWYYPFPDYKLATSLLAEDFIRNSSSAWSCLSRISSRDYTAIWHSSLDEQLFWQTAAAAGSLEEMANSFVLILQRRGAIDSEKSLVPFDFVHYSGHGRKPEFRVIVEKRKGEHTVKKRRIFQRTNPDHDAVVVQHLEDEPFYEGKPLAVHWANVLRSCSSSVTLDALLKKYYQYVIKECERVSANRLLDLLPFNIIIAEDGTWHSFDQEWVAKQDVVPQFIFFRAVLYFYLENKEILRPFCRRQNLKNGWEFVEYCLGRLLYSGEFNLKEFIAFENKIQQAVGRSEVVDSVECILDSTLEHTKNAWSWEKTSLVWGEEEVVVSKPVSSSQCDQGQSIIFQLPNEACSSPYIQLSLGIPKEKIGLVFTLHSFVLYGCLAAGKRDKIIPIEPDKKMPSLITLTGLTFYPNIRGGVFVVDEKEPQVLHFLFPQVDDRQKFSSLDCEVVLEVFGESDIHVYLEQCKIEKQCLAVLLEEKQQQLAQIEGSRAWQLLLRLKKAKEKIVGLLEWKTRETLVALGEISVSDNQGEDLKGEMISVILPVYNTGPDELRRTVESVLVQSYPNWELIIVDSCSTDMITQHALAGIKHPKIKIHYLKKSHNLTTAMDEGASLAVGSWITILGHFDRYRPDALWTFLQEVAGGEQDVLYCDEEIIERSGDVLDVRNKPGFNIDKLDGIDIIGRTLFIRRSLYKQAGGLNHELDGVHLFDLVLRASQYTEKIVHVKQALYQTRQFVPPTQDELDRVYSISKRVWERYKDTR